MELCLAGGAITIFGKALHCLAKVGEEISVEATSTQVTLRTVSSSRSAYGCYAFDIEFFDQYSVVTAASDKVISCRVLAKSATTVFKALPHIEKTVNKCELSLDPKNNYFAVRFHCKFGIVQTFKLYYEECETLQAVYNREGCANKVQSSYTVLNEAIHNFQSDVEEISFFVAEEAFKISNDVEIDYNRRDPEKKLRTNVAIDATEFQQYLVSVPGSVTFCFKELRSILSFCDYVGEPMTISFDTGGRPIIFNVSGIGFHCDYVLATLPEKMTQPDMIKTQGSSQKSETAQPRHSQHATQQSSRSASQVSNALRATKSESEFSQPALMVSKEVLVVPQRAASHDLRDDDDEEAVDATVRPAARIDNDDASENDDEVVAGTPPMTKRFKGLLGIELSNSAPPLKQLVDDTDEEEVGDSQKSE